MLIKSCYTHSERPGHTVWAHDGTCHVFFFLPMAGQIRDVPSPDGSRRHSPPPRAEPPAPRTVGEKTGGEKRMGKTTLRTKNDPCPFFRSKTASET